MKNEIPERPDLLEAFLDAVLAGANKHQQDVPIPNDVLADMKAAKLQLSSLHTAVQLSEGQVRQDKQDLRDYVPKAQEVATRARDAVFLKYGHKDEVLVDFSLSTPRKRAKKGTNAAAKAARANDLLAKAQARLDRAKVRMSQLEAHVAQRQADAAHAALALPAEPTPASEPNPSSNK